MGHNLTDLLAGGGLFLFTGVDIASTESTILELVSKLGVIAVLWYWLRDLKSQMKEQLTTFDKETNEIRNHYDKIIVDKTTEFIDYKDRIGDQLKEREEYIQKLQDRLLDNTPSN